MPRWSCAWFPVGVLCLVGASQQLVHLTHQEQRLRLGIRRRIPFGHAAQFVPRLLEIAVRYIDPGQLRACGGRPGTGGILLQHPPEHAPGVVAFAGHFKIPARLNQRIGGLTAPGMKHLHPLVGQGGIPRVLERGERFTDVPPCVGGLRIVLVRKGEGLERQPRVIVLLELQLGEPERESGVDPLGGIGVAANELFELFLRQVVQPVVVQIDGELEIRVFFGVLGLEGACNSQDTEG
jgi:hypothetical protein